MAGKPPHGPCHQLMNGGYVSQEFVAGFFFLFNHNCHLVPARQARRVLVVIGTAVSPFI